MLTGDRRATAGLRYVAFDLLAERGDDLRARSWRERDERLRSLIPGSPLIRVIDSRPASECAHAAIVKLGFEGSVLKQTGSVYRSGRHACWRKLKARHTALATLLSAREAHDGRIFAVCDLNGRRVVAAARARTSELVGQIVQLVYSRVDADGTLREVRVTESATTENR
jgi:ATP-dependent DNA ligase